MTAWSRWLADAVMTLAQRTAPPQRCDWLAAMRAETAHLPDDRAAMFAIGCLMAMVRARAATPAFILGATRSALVAGAAIFAVLNLSLAESLASANSVGPSRLTQVAAATFAFGAVATAWLGLRPMTWLAAPVLLLAAAFTLVCSLLPLMDHMHFYRAIGIEYCFILMLAMLSGHYVPRWVGGPEWGKLP
jgi:hypothetical protein